VEQLLSLRLLVWCRASVLTLTRLIALTVAAVVLLRAAKSSYRVDWLLSLLELWRVCGHCGRPNIDKLLLLSRCNVLIAHHLNVAEIEGHREDERLDLPGLRLLIHVLNKVAFALNAPIGDLADLLRVERLPRLVIHVFVERHNVDGIYEVDEGVANVAAIVQVERQIEEVKATIVFPVDSL